MAKIFKTIAVVLGVLDVIGAIVMANAFGEFNFGIFLSAILVCALSVLIIYAIGEHFGNQEEANRILREFLNRQPEKEAKLPEHFGGSRTPVPQHIQGKTDNVSGGYFSKKAPGPWTCRDCNTANSETRTTCENCGRNR